MTVKPFAWKLLAPIAVAVCLVAGLAVSVSGLWNPDWRLVIRSAACVDADVVRLGDVAVVHGEMDSEQWEELSATELWRAPQLGDGAQVVDRNRLKRLFINILGDVGYFCVYPDRLTIQRGGEVLDEIELRQRVVDFLTPRIQALSGFKGEVELTEFSLPEHVFLDDKFDEVEIEPSGRIKPGRVSLRFTVAGPNGEVRRKVAGSVFVNVHQPVPVAKRPLNRGDRLSRDLVTFKRKNLAYLAGPVWDGRGGPWRLKRSVGSSQVIYASHLESQPKISAGDKITLMYQSDHIRLTVPAKALKDGRLGETIPVENMQSKREVLGRVQDSETVITP
jgi:flagella basal body P-ring formation protein FlgA